MATNNISRLFSVIFVLIAFSAAAQTDSIRLSITDTIHTDAVALPIADTTPDATKPAAPLRKEYKLTANYGKVDGSYDFWTCTPPGYDTLESNKKPLVVFLHGASLCGHDLGSVRRYGPLNAISVGCPVDAVVLAPLNGGGAWNPRKINSLIDWTIDNFNVDTTRIYVFGMSLGGYGTMDYCATYPERVAAGIAMCGGATVDVTGLSKLPFWIIHGTADRAVGVNNSKVVVEQLKSKNLDSLLMFTWLNGASHGTLARIFYLPKTYEWLFSHSIADSARTINRDCEISNSDLVRVYSKLDRHSQQIKVVGYNPPKQTYAASSARSQQPVDYSNAEVYVVQNGDVLVNISKRTNTSVDEICRLNNISHNTTLRVGQKLIIRAK